MFEKTNMPSKKKIRKVSENVKKKGNETDFIMNLK